MNSILRECLGKYALVYLDDVIIYSKNMEEHKIHIRRIFELLKENDLVVSEKKCEWGQDKLIFLGHTVNGEGIKVENIVDWPTPLNITEESGNQYLVTATDYGTGWAYTTPLKARSSLAAVKLVKAIIENHGLSHLITTDNGQEFEGNLFKNYLEGHRIKHNRISPYHPQSNGLVERFHGTLMNRLRKYCVPDRQDEWDLYIVAVTTQEYCDDKGKAPIEDIGVFRQERIDEVNRKARLGSLNAEDGYTERDLKIGSTVLRHYKQRPSKLHPKWDGPFIIYHSNPNGSYKLRAPNGHPLKGTVTGN
ncbi:hypothetical protein MJO28_015331 [Puccinia striiformis f. sp. tritici]|uniref:Uncharacterized protein n=1 Tax=Puccinia striiformis f. sp. tritici TaxID=168172 RepID=A0ACC0DTH1_9BASI|nr:hypothetical protein MJO28_015331 [Puccinia striiformis f. sp. tritici]